MSVAQRGKRNSTPHDQRQVSVKSVESRLQGYFMDFSQPGAMPQAKIEAAPLALKTYRFGEMSLILTIGKIQFRRGYRRPWIPLKIGLENRLAILRKQLQQRCHIQAVMKRREPCQIFFR